MTECQICLEEIIRCPQCKKSFHLKCLQKWADVSNTCPNCIFSFNKKPPLPPRPPRLKKNGFLPVML